MSTSDAAGPLVAVLGATGQQGGATAGALLRAGVRVRVIVRDPSKASALADAGAEVVQGDVSDAASLGPALRGADRLSALTVFTERGTEGEVADGRRIVDAAEEAGIGLVVYSSVGGAERDTGIPHFESKRQVELHLERSGLPFKLVRPVYFMENLAAQRPRVEDGEVVVRMPLPDGVPLQMIAVDDIGRALAAVLQDPDRLPGTAVEIGGDQRTGSAIAAAFAARTGRPARYEELDPAVLGDDDLRAMFAWFARLPAYRADFAATARLVDGATELPAWLAARQDVVAA